MIFGWASHTLATMEAEEEAFGVRNGMLSTYTDFVQSPSFPADYAQAAADRDAVLLIAWEPWDWNKDPGQQPEFAPRRVAAGEHDDYIRSWLRTAQVWSLKTRISVRFAPEMNDSSRPWANGVPTVGYDPTTPQEYIDMWRHVYMIKRTVAPSVEFMWNPLNFGAGAHPFDAYFPGIDYVDSLALNGFNWSDAQSPDGVWQGVDDVFGFSGDENTPVNKLVSLAQDKPWGFAEVASAPDNPDDFQSGGKFHSAWGSWVFEWPENPPYEETAEDWITQEGWIEMLMRRAADAGASFFDLFHTIKETDWRLTDTLRGRNIPQNVRDAGYPITFGSDKPSNPQTFSGLVENLWNRIRLAIDDKILNALNYKNAAETASTAAQAAKTAAEKAAGDAAGAAKAEVDKLVAGAPAAFDTLAEIAAELSDNETERAALTTALSKKVETSDVSVFAGANGKIPRREDTSDNIRVGNPPTETYHLTNKAYVDSTKVHAYGNMSMTLWYGTQIEYDALPAATRNASGFIAVIY